MKKKKTNLIDLKFRLFLLLMSSLLINSHTRTHTHKQKQTHIHKEELRNVHIQNHITKQIYT